MSVSLGLTPITIVGTDPVQGSSSYSAVHNPIIFGFTRYDFLIDEVIVAGQFADVYPLGLPDANFDAIQTGDVVYVNNSEVVGAFTVVLTTASYVKIFVDNIFTDGTYPNGTLILTTTIKSWRLEVQIGMMDTGTFIPLVTSSWVNKIDGTIYVDVSEYLKSQVSMTNDYDYTTVNIKDLKLSRLYAIKYREVYTGHTEEDFVLDSGVYAITNSAKQIGDLYGGNMAEFVPFAEDMPVNEKAKFLSGFLIPRHWLIAPFDLAFIYGDQLIGTVTRKKLPLDANGVAGLGVDTALSSAGADYINRMILSDTGSTAYWLQMALSNDGHLITESKLVKIETDCTKHPVYLCWKSKNGAWDYWLFDWNQTLKRNTGDLKQYEPYFTDFEAATARIKVASKTSVPTMILGASVVPVNDVYYNEQYPGLMGLIDSPEVLMLMNLSTWVADGAPVWRTVIPKPGSFKVFETKNRFSDIEIEISLPYLQIESQ